MIQYRIQGGSRQIAESCLFCIETEVNRNGRLDGRDTSRAMHYSAGLHTRHLCALECGLRYDIIIIIIRWFTLAGL
jgi:hypothetical protein